MSPSWVLENREYICKSATVALCSILRNLNVTCMPVVTKGHSLAVVSIDNRSTFIDLTAGGIGYGKVNKYITAIPRTK